MLSSYVCRFISSLLALMLVSSSTQSAGRVTTQASAAITATAYVEPSLGLTEAASEMPADFTIEGDQNLYWLYHPDLEGVKVLINGNLTPIQTERFQSHALASLISLSPVETGRSVTVTLIYTDN